MAVNMKRSRESTTALVKEVCPFECQPCCIPYLACCFCCFVYPFFYHCLFSICHSSHLNPPQWRYDHTTATYLLLLSKKQRGKPVRLRPEPAGCEDSCSPLHQGLQVRLRTTTSVVVFSFRATDSWSYRHRLNPVSQLSSVVFDLFVLFYFSQDKGRPSLQ